jgi:predicted transposase YbfD/YdcC
MSGCQSWEEIADYGEERQQWFSTFLNLPHGVASHDTFGRVFSLLEPQAFQQAFFTWLCSVKSILEPNHHIAIDGKFLNASLQQPGCKWSAIQMVSAWCTNMGLCLAQRKSVAEKDQGEKRVMEELIHSLHLKGCVVSIDANGATPRIIDSLQAQGANYVIGLKSNQNATKLLAQAAFAKPEINEHQSFETIDKGHGRIEHRVYERVSAERALYDKLGLERGWDKWCSKFAGLKSFVRVTTQRTQNEKTTTETRYYFSSLNDVEYMARIIRDHWAVENNLHRTLDVSFGEDYSQVRIGHAAENFAILRRMVLNMLKLDTEKKRSIRRKQMACAINPNNMLKVFGLAADRITTST